MRSRTFSTTYSTRDSPYIDDPFVDDGTCYTGNGILRPEYRLCRTRVQPHTCVRVRTKRSVRNGGIALKRTSNLDHNRSSYLRRQLVLGPTGWLRRR